MTFAGARALDNRPASGLGSTMEIIRECSVINWVWLRILFKGTSFPPDIIGDHSVGSGSERSGVEGGLDGWRQLLVFVPLLTWRKRTCHSNGYSTLKLVHSKQRVMASAVRALSTHPYIPLYQKVWSGAKKWSKKKKEVLHKLESTFIYQSDMKLLNQLCRLHSRHSDCHCVVPFVRIWKVGQVMWKVRGASLLW